MLRRSRTTEGGSLVCELCGHLAFKLYSTVVEVTDDGKQANQWKKTQTENVKVSTKIILSKDTSINLICKF